MCSARALRLWAPGIFCVSLLCAQNIAEIQRYPAYRAELEQFQAAFNQPRTGDQGESVARAGISKAQGAADRDGEAHWLRMLGASFERRGDYKQARPYYEQSLAIRRELKLKPDILLLTHGIGLVCYRTRDFPAALSYLTEAARLAADTGDSTTEARVDSLLVRVHTDMADFPAALRDGFESLRVWQAMPKKSEPDIAVALDLIGTVFHNLEQPRKALDYYRQALEIRLRSAPQAVTDSYTHVGAELDKLGSHAEAIQYFQKVLDERRKAKNPGPVAGALVNLGNAQQGLGDLVAARKSFTEASTLTEEKGITRTDAALALYGLGNIDIAEKKVDDALTHHRAAYKIRNESADALGSLHSLNRIAIALELGRRWPEALEAHREAMVAFEALLARIADPVQALEFRRTSEILYPHHARVLIELGRKEEALGIAERGRGIGFSRIASMNARRYADLLNPGQKSALSNATVRLAQARNRLRSAAESGDDAAERDSELAYLQAERELNRVRDDLFSADRRLQPGAKMPDQPGFADLTAYARGRSDTLFLEWLAIGNEGVLFVVSASGGLSTYEMPVPLDEISASAESWRRALRSGQRARGVKLDVTPVGNEPALARQVYDAILGPARKIVEAHKFSRLAIVADGPLLQIPFPALVDDAGNRLMENYSISTAVSIGSLLNHSEERAPRAVSLYAIGDPIGPGQMRLLVPQKTRFEPLAGAREEALAIAGLFPNRASAIGPEAREGTVKRQMEHYEILHFATHGILDGVDPLRSGLLLGAEPPDSVEDGVLEAWEIASIPLSSRLAVLSACQTGQGSQTPGDGLLGLSWAFQAAGCPNVVASLWSVDDAATRTLMLEFYKGIRAGKRVDDSMRAAMAATRANKSYQSPYYWSAFQVIGPAHSILSPNIVGLR